MSEAEHSDHGIVGEDSAAAGVRREELRRAHFAQYKAQVLTAYAEMKKRRLDAGHGMRTGALVAPPVVVRNNLKP